MKKIRIVLLSTAMTVMSSLANAALFDVSLISTLGSTGSGSAWFDGSDLIVDQVTTTTVTGIGTADISAYATYEGSIAGTTWTSSGIADSIVSCSGDAMVCGFAPAGGPVTDGTIFSLDTILGGSWDALVSVATVTTTLTPAAPSAVPVPAAAWLFGSALVGLAGVGRKRQVA